MEVHFTSLGGGGGSRVGSRVVAVCAYGAGAPLVDGMEGRVGACCGGWAVVIVAVALLVVSMLWSISGGGIWGVA